MPIEVDENEYAVMKQLSGFAQSALNNPKTRRQILEIQKVLNPDAAIPELDAAKPLMDDLRAIREELAADRKARAEERAKEDEDRRTAALRAKWEEGRKVARTQGYTDEESLTNLEKFMADTGIVDHNIAIGAYERLHPRAEPISTGSNRFTPFKDPAAVDQNDIAMKALWGGDDEGFLRHAIGQTLTDMRSQGGR